MMIAERLGRTVHELRFGGPGHEAMSTGEWFDWVALLTIVEPGEREAARQAADGGERFD